MAAIKKREVARGHGQPKHLPAATAWFCYSFNRSTGLLDENSGYESTANEINRQSWPWCYIEVEADETCGDDKCKNAAEKCHEANTLLKRVQAEPNTIGTAIHQLEQPGWQIHDDLIGQENTPPLENVISKPQSRRRGRRSSKWQNMDAAIRTEKSGRRQVDDMLYDATRIGKQKSKPIPKPIALTEDNATPQELIDLQKQVDIDWEDVADDILREVLDDPDAYAAARDADKAMATAKPAILLGTFPVETALQICKHIKQHYKVTPHCLTLGNSKTQNVFIPGETNNKKRNNIRRWMRRNFK